MPSNTTHSYPAWTTVKSGPVKNNSATVLMGGNARTTDAHPNVSQTLGIAVLGYHSAINGSIVPGPYTPTPGNSIRCVTNVISGDYAKQTAGRYIIVRFTNYIAGNASTLLNFAGSNAGRKPYAAFSGLVRTQKYVTTGGWIYQTGQAVSRGFGTDAEGSEPFPTYSAPGNLTFMYTGKLAHTQGYSAKND